MLLLFLLSKGSADNQLNAYQALRLEEPHIFGLSLMMV
jgi:hypothetical protein